MPIYEYKCVSCGKEFEVIQKFSDEPVKKCIECGGRVEKLVSQSSFVLKGSGWHATDYGKGAKKESKDSSSSKPPCSSCPNC